ncbi:MAG: hypothetical protein H6Q30_1822 [Bacteroidetes bacterium]|jgi:hypothetical protein|nr:hypothetical protein [Bacteroidota bacterium]
MWKKRLEPPQAIDPVRIGGKRTVMSLAAIVAIAVLLLFIIRFTLL